MVAEHDGVSIETCEVCGTSHQYPEGFPAEMRGCPVCRGREQEVMVQARRIMDENPGLGYAEAALRARDELDAATHVTSADELSGGDEATS